MEIGAVGGGVVGVVLERGAFDGGVVVVVVDDVSVVGDDGGRGMVRGNDGSVRSMGASDRGELIGCGHRTIRN